ncbi:MAG: Maf-like protein YhdE [Pseudomonadota bacterium]|jgi:septum formation protein
MKNFVYLASQSPRRRQLLEQIGVQYELLLATPEEDAESLEVVLPNEAPLTYVKRVTQLKLEAAVQRMKQRDLPNAPVLCADTTVALGRSILGKPENAADALRILKMLSGQTHRVLTAVAVASGRKRVSEVSISQVTFAPMTLGQMKNYIATGEPMGKAGAYGVQGAAAAYISQIKGSYTGIMGLPLFETAQLLKQI